MENLSELALDKQEKPKISVLMSVHNGADTLARSIESIINQTFTDWEMIICDDGSIDNSYELLLSFQEADRRIKIIKNDTNQGLAYSLNRTIEIAKSIILARQDSDDWSDACRFEKQYRFIMGHPEYAIVGTCWYNIDSRGNKTEHTAREYIQVKNLVSDGGFLHPSWMMRKDLLSQVGFYTVNKYTLRSQDYHLVLKLYGAGFTIYNLQEFLYYYTVDEGTFKRSKNWKRVKGLMWIRWDGYRRNKFPIWSYVYVLKPLAVNLIPYSIIRKHYEKRYK